ncbi:MAG: hypothetical protein RDV41_02185 [Planctomycetota bacterium]|nr:hypothetical protein [Planctomycetota bacterium]
MGRSFAAVFSLFGVAVACATCIVVETPTSRLLTICLAVFWLFAVLGYVIGRAGEAILAELEKMSVLPPSVDAPAPPAKSETAQKPAAAPAPEKKT